MQSDLIRDTQISNPLTLHSKTCRDCFAQLFTTISRHLQPDDANDFFDSGFPTT